MYFSKLPGSEVEADIVAKEETYDQCGEEPSAPAPPVHINTISRHWQKMDGSWVDIDLSCVEVGAGEVDLLQGNNCLGNQARIHE